MCRVGDCAHGGGAALVVDVSDGLRPHIQHQGVDQLDVVAVPRLVGHLGVDRKIKQRPGQDPTSHVQHSIQAITFFGAGVWGRILIRMYIVFSKYVYSFLFIFYCIMYLLAVFLYRHLPYHKFQ